MVLRHRGRQSLAFPEQARTVRSRQRRYREPKPPRIQALLTQARQLRERLDATPGLTRDALAKEIGLNPTCLTRILNLLNLAPEIQRYIAALPPSVTRGKLTERRLRYIARNEDKDLQLKEFARLLETPERASKGKTGGQQAPQPPFFGSIQSRI